MKRRSWLDIAAGWTRNRRRGTSRSVMAAAPDLTIIYSGDAVDWDKYMAECFAQVTDPEPIHINHERLDQLSFPLTNDQNQTLTSSKCVLVIISPEFLDFVNKHADVFELGKLLRPHQTVAILCGVQEMDVNRFQKAALVSYDCWTRLVAQDQDENFVLSVIRITREILTRMDDGHTAHKPHFQLSPRKVKEGNNKVFLMMKKQISEKQKIQVFLDVDGGREVVVKRRNAYTFQFFVPDNYLRYSRMIKVHMRCDDCFLGVREIKVESRMGELYSILSSVNSPYELLCETLGIASYHEVDDILTKNFVQNSTEGLWLLAGNGVVDKKKSEEELPTLMHFAARYGLPKLMKAILQYPMAMPASRMRNVRGLTPAQLANSSGHNGIALLLEEFQKTLVAVKGRLNENCSLLEQKPLPTQQRPFEYQNITYCNETYDVPLNTVVPASRPTSTGSNDPKSPDYLSMSGVNPLYADKLEPHQLVLLGLDERLQESECNFQYFTNDSVEVKDKETIKLESPPRHYPSGLCPSQKELLDIMDKYKKGTPLTDVEKQFNIWQTKHKETSNQNALTSLRDAYKMMQKQQKTPKKPAFSLTELKHSLFKLGKKDGQASSANTLERKRERLLSRSEDSPVGLDGFRPVSTLSTASTNSSSSSSSFDRFSAISAGSLYDSGNHSDSCDETARLKESKPNEESSHALIGPKVSLSLRPPAPPPRPPKFLPKTAKKNKGQSEAESRESHNYYNQRALRECSPDYIVPNSDTYVLASDVEETINALGSSNDIRLAERKHSLHLQRTCKTVTSSGDEIYYDIPAPPLPVRRNADSGLTSLVDPAQDYHFPKSPIRKVSGVESALQNYSVPRFSHNISNERYPCTPPRPAMPRPVLSTINIPLEVNALLQNPNLSDSPNEEKCDSMPTEPPPPPPMESDYDILPFPRKYTPNT